MKRLSLMVLVVLLLVVSALPAMARNPRAHDSANGEGGAVAPSDGGIWGNGGYGGSYGLSGQSPNTVCTGGGADYHAGGKDFWTSVGYCYP